MRTWQSHGLGTWFVVLAGLGVASGTAWATSHVVPPPEALPLAPPAAAWQGFMAYREALRWFGGVVLALMVVLVLSHFAVYGYHHVRPTGKLIRRYTSKEVLLHALLTLAFVGAWASSTYLILAKYAFGYWARDFPVPFGRVSNTTHVTAGLLFFAALLALGIIWRRPMRFAPYDSTWLREFGGYFTRRHRILPAGHFNAGQKIWFYSALVVGVLVTVSGALIYFPALFGPRVSVLLYVVHTGLGVVLSAAVIVHVYLAVLVHPHAIRSMISGTIDEACLREDYPLERFPSRRRRAGGRRPRPHAPRS